MALGAKMADFAGYQMPILYSSIKEEHQAVRNTLGIFDVSHMGEFIIKGKEALDFVNYVTSNDASKLSPGQIQYSCFPTPEGGIVDDLLVYRLFEDNCAVGEQAFLLVVNASNIEKDWNWIEGHNRFQVRMKDISERTGLVAVQGPKAAEILQVFTDIDLSSIKYYTFRKGNFAGCENILISATGYTGSGGFEIYARSDQIGGIWDQIMETGQATPAGLGARDTLRMEMGYCLYGNDINAETSPLEAGLGWITKLKQGDFVGRDYLVQQKEHGLKRKLVGLKVNDRRVPRHGYEVFDEKGEKHIGFITSGTQSPTLNEPIGLAYVEMAYSPIGTPICFSTGTKNIAAEVCKLPFVKI